MNNVHLYPFSHANRSDTENMTGCQTVNSSPSTATRKTTQRNVACFFSIQPFPPLLLSALLLATRIPHERYHPRVGTAEALSHGVYNAHLKETSE